MSKLCLVLGGSGFIGSHLVRTLTKRGSRVRVFGRDLGKFQRNVGSVEEVEFQQGDISSQSDLEVALTDVTDVVHLVCSTVPATSMKDFSFDLESNVLPFIQLLEIIRKHDQVNRFVYVSSGGVVYGNPSVFQPIPETHPTNPISSYGLTKLISEQYVRLCLAGSQICSYVIRPSNAYGENQDLGRPQGAVGHFLLSLATDSPITIYGDGSTVRDLVYVKDLVAAIALCLEYPPSAPGTVSTLNVGSGMGTSITQLIDIIEKITNRHFTVIRQPERSFDCRYNVLDISKIHQIFGWCPQVSVEEGIIRVWQEIRWQYG